MKKNENKELSLRAEGVAIPRVKALSPITLALAAILSIGTISESRADAYSISCGTGQVTCGTSCINYGVPCYSYDDDGRLKEVIASFEHDEWGGNDYNTVYRTVLTYENGELTGATQNRYGYRDDSIVSSGETGVSISVLDESIILSPGSSGYGYTLTLDKDGKLLKDGLRGDAIGLSDIKSYTYDSETGEISNRTLYSCDNSGNCTATTTEEYSQVIDGNTIKEYIGNELVGVYNYTDAYIANQAAKKCNKTKSCTSCSGGKVLQGGECVASCGPSFRLNDGECDRIRYTPAEAAQYLKDTDNTIIMTFKVNR